MSDSRHYVVTEGGRPSSLDELVDYLKENLYLIESAIKALNLDATEKWEDLRTPMSAMKLTGNSDPSFELLRDGIYAYAFQPGQTNELVFVQQLPHAYREGSTLHPHIHWTTKSASVGEVVVWGLEYTYASINGTFATTVKEKVTATCGIAYTHQLKAFSEISASDANISAMILGRLYREASAGAGDTYSGNAFLLEFDTHYEKDDDGSRREYVK